MFHAVKDLALIDTEEKLESLLTSLPEPKPETLEFILNAIRTALPNLRQLFLQFAKQLPHHHAGGRPRELADPEVRRKIQEELKRRRKPGILLEDLYGSLARDYGVSATTIKRIRLADELKFGSYCCVELSPVHVSATLLNRCVLVAISPCVGLSRW